MESFDEGHQERLNWLGRRYPSFEDLVLLAEARGALVGFADLGEEALFIASEGLEPAAILLPIGLGNLRACWLLAHEIGHLVQHEGPKGKWLYSKSERQANRWAACALIPEARVRLHANASLDAFIAALARHYEEIPPVDCDLRRLAARIARERLSCLAEKG